jgi:hypothetical protein
MDPRRPAGQRVDDNNNHDNNYYHQPNNHHNNNDGSPNNNDNSGPSPAQQRGKSLAHPHYTRCQKMRQSQLKKGGGGQSGGFISK